MIPVRFNSDNKILAAPALFEVLLFLLQKGQNRRCTLQQQCTAQHFNARCKSVGILGCVLWHQCSRCVACCAIFAVRAAASDKETEEIWEAADLVDHVAMSGGDCVWHY